LAQYRTRKQAVMREADRLFTRVAPRRRSTIMFITSSTAEFSSEKYGPRLVDGL
jgi:hypothetical protein